MFNYCTRRYGLLNEDKVMKPEAMCTEGSYAENIMTELG